MTFVPPPRYPTPDYNLFGKTIANLPDVFYKGAQQKQQYELAHAFPNGLPTANGVTDYKSVQDTLAKFGQPGGALSLAPEILQQQQLQQANRDYQQQFGGQPGAPAAPAPAPAPQPPADLSNNPPASAAASIPTSTSAPAPAARAPAPAPAPAQPRMPSPPPLFAALEGQYGLPSGYLSSTAKIESNGNPNAVNRQSGAAGEFQFMPGTAKDVGVNNPYDPAQAAIGAAKLAANNTAALTKALGRAPTAAELYLAHQEGAAGAAKLLANPNAKASDVVGLKAVIQNGGSPNMTAGQFAGLWINRFNRTAGGSQNFGLSGPQPGGPGVAMPPGAAPPSMAGSLLAMNPQAANVGAAMPTMQAAPGGSPYGALTQMPTQGGQPRPLADPAPAPGVYAPPVPMAAPAAPQAAPQPMQPAAPTPAQVGRPISPQPPMPVNPYTNRPFTNPETAINWLQQRIATTGRNPADASLTRYYEQQLAGIAAAIKPVTMKRGEEILDPRTGQVLAGSPEPQKFGVIGKDEYGQPTYGWINPQAQTVSPLAPAAAGSGGASDAGAPGASNVHGDAYLQSIAPNTATTVKALADGRMAFPSGYALKSPYWQKMLQFTAQYDPSFDAVQYNARARARVDATSGKLAQNNNSLNTGIGHLTQMADAIDALHNGNWQSANAAKNWLSAEFGGTGPTNFNAIRDRVAPEITKIWRGSGGAEADIKRDIDTLSSANSPAQLYGSIGEIANLMKSKIEANESQYQQVMGPQGLPLQMITPQSQKAIERLERLSGGGSPTSQGNSGLPAGWSVTVR